MVNSLFAKLTLTLLVMFCLLGLLFVSVTLFSTNLYHQEVMQKLNRGVAEHIVKDTPILENGKLNRVALKQLFNTLMIFNPSLEIYLLDHEGDIMAFSAPPWKVVRTSVDLTPIKQLLQQSRPFPLKGDDPRDFQNSKIFSAAPVEYPGEFSGFLYVILGGEEYDDIMARVQGSYILKFSLLIIAAGLLFSAIAGVVLLASTTNKLKRLSTAMIKFKQHPSLDPGFLSSKTTKGDEIDQLAATFRAMAEKIVSQLDNLQTTDQLRRELVANVSHDLRTPLATLQGYIETLMIKDAQLTQEQRQEYLQVAIKHCQRLNKLVVELFELAKLDAKETRAKKEPFNLAELIQDIVQKFNLKAYEKSIKMGVKTELSAVFVYADISLIERVIENLLENALRYTQENGQVEIELQAQHEHILVQVRDNGVGIPENEMPYIFDRFYQLDKTRSQEENGSGLGLAIVKRIIELHQSVIDVSREPNGYTSFTFSLPIPAG